MMRWMGILLLLACVTPSLAHDSWISRGGYRNKVGDWCCGERDCKTEKADHTSLGWVLKQDGTRVPESKTLPSPDGEVWVCRWGGGVKCVFVPGEGT